MTDPLRQIARVQAKLRRLAAQEGVAQALDEGAALIVREARPYPPERPGQTYVRTGLLGASWGREGVQRTADGYATAVTNDRPRVAFVVDAVRQASIHRRRWRTTRDLAATYGPLVRERVRRALLQGWRRA